jgi:hypothetical protein
MIRKFKLLVLADAAQDSDEAFNAWYDEIHLGDVLKLQDYIAAQRFRKSAVVAADHAYKYAAIYEVETDDPDAAVTRLLEASGTERMPLSETLLPNFYCVLYEEMGSARHG